MIIYRKNFTLSTDIIGFDLDLAGGWTPDCGGKLDYDPQFVSGSSRVYPDGDYVCSLSIGEDEIISTEIMSADSVAEAKRACEDWMEEKAALIRSAVVSVLKSDASDSSLTE